jgi:hypothetical protein
MGRGLAKRILTNEGVHYQAEEAAGAFLDNLQAPYSRDLQARAEWVAETFDELTDRELDGVVNGLFSKWTAEFQPVESLISEDDNQ